MINTQTDVKVSVYATSEMYKNSAMDLISFDILIDQLT